MFREIGKIAGLAWMTFAVGVSAPAMAQDGTAAATAEEEEAPPPVVRLERLPPRVSWELGVQMSYGDITYWRDEVVPWAGWGVRTGGGKNFGPHRVGGGISFSAEGPLPIHYTGNLEPHGMWDWISEKGLHLGASAGPTFLVHSRTESKGRPGQTVLGLTGALAGRIGYSQTWTRVGRRVFVYVEPKVRVIDDLPSPVLTLIVGQGKGR